MRGGTTCEIWHRGAAHARWEPRRRREKRRGPWHKYCTSSSPVVPTDMSAGVWVKISGRRQIAECFTHEKVEHDFLSCSTVTLVQTVGGTGQPGDAMSRYLYQLHQGAHAAPGRVLAGAHPQPLGQPQVDGEQGAERYADEGRVEPYTVLLWQPLTARRARGRAGAPAPSGALRGSEAGGGGVGALPLEQVRRGRPVQRLRQWHEVVAAVGAAEHRASSAATGVFSFRRRHGVCLSSGGWYQWCRWAAVVIYLQCCAVCRFFSLSVVRFTILLTSSSSKPYRHLCCSLRKAPWETMFFPGTYTWLLLSAFIRPRWDKQSIALVVT